MTDRRAAGIRTWLLLWLAIAASQGAAAAEVSEQAHDLLEKRCMVCHGCYDAPCQLKLEAHEGLQRGASLDKVYDSTRLIAANMTRLFDDGLTEAQWRKKGFFPVINEAQPDRGVMYRMLELKQTNPLPPTGALPEGFDFSLYREQQCPREDEFKDFAKAQPLSGMPYGLPGLQTEEHETMLSWLELGAPPRQAEPLSDELLETIRRWEAFLNASDNKSRLMARYIYEHLFLANLYLDDAGEPAWFRLVRSTTAPGKNLGLIASRRPYDDPGTSTFYYRLQRMAVTPLEKIHMPYRFDRARMTWYRELFLEPEYDVGTLPGYEQKLAANPFRVYQSIPVQSRYRFLLEEAQFTIMNFIKGPVCRGQVALNVIEDHFWVMFTDPGEIDPEHDQAFLARESDNLRLPVARTGTAIDLLAWRRYARAHDKYQKAKARYLQQQLTRDNRNLDIESLWDGDGVNDNAALTVFRHFDTASVVKGFVGDVPKTAWVIGYSLLERIHYLLVAGFDVYGSLAHQLESRLYMDFLRMEGEFNFLLMMPADKRRELRDFWYRDASESVKNHVFAQTEVAQRPNDITYVTDDPKRELLLTMRELIHGARASAYDYRRSASEPMVEAFQALEADIGAHNQFLPQVSFINVIGNGRDEAYTLLRNSGYSNIAQLFDEDDRRLPEEDKLTIARGFIGAFPNQFFQVHEKQVPLFAADIAALETQEDFRRFETRYAVRRNSPWFWRVSDKFQAMNKAENPRAAGLFDLNRYRGYAD